MALKLVGLDGGPLGLLTHPTPSPPAIECIAWLQSLLDGEVRVVLPAISDYEIRREYLLRQNQVSIRRLDALREIVDWAEIEDEVLIEGSELWSQIRRKGKPTSHPKSLDVDCLIATQVRRYAETLGFTEEEWLIATVDIGDMPNLAPAAHWTKIKPIPPI